MSRGIWLKDVGLWHTISDLQDIFDVCRSSGACSPRCQTADQSGLSITGCAESAGNVFFDLEIY